MNQNSLKPPRPEHHKPKSDRYNPAERRPLPPRSKPTDEESEVANKESKSIERGKPQKKKQDEKEVRSTTFNNRVNQNQPQGSKKNLERKPLKENINLSNMNRSVERKPVNEQKPLNSIVPKVPHEQRKSENHSRYMTTYSESNSPSVKIESLPTSPRVHDGIANLRLLFRRSVETSSSLKPRCLEQIHLSSNKKYNCCTYLPYAERSLRAFEPSLRSPFPGSSGKARTNQTEFANFVQLRPP